MYFVKQALLIDTKFYITGGHNDANNASRTGKATSSKININNTGQSIKQNVLFTPKRTTRSTLLTVTTPRKDKIIDDKKEPHGTPKPMLTPQVRRR